jgi:hypothetical protein
LAIAVNTVMAMMAQPQPAPALAAMLQRALRAFAPKPDDRR